MPGTAAGTQRFEHLDRRLGDLLDARLLRGLLAGDDHVRLEDRAFEHDVA